MFVDKRWVFPLCPDKPQNLPHSSTMPYNGFRAVPGNGFVETVKFPEWNRGKHVVLHVPVHSPVQKGHQWAEFHGVAVHTPVWDIPGQAHMLNDFTGPGKECGEEVTAGNQIDQRPEAQPGKGRDQYYMADELKTGPRDHSVSPGIVLFEERVPGEGVREVFAPEVCPVSSHNQTGTS